MKANVIEKNFKETLNIIAGLGMTAEEIKSNAKFYNELAIEAMEYFGKVALLSNRNRSAINSTGIEFDEFLDDVVMHFLNKLDDVIACDESGRIPFIINMTNNKVIDKVRAWNRIYGTTKKKNEDSSVEETDEQIEVAVSFLDELSWGFVADKHNIEQEYEDREMAKLVLATLASEAKAYDAVAFMAINILGWKTSTYAEKLMVDGYQNTLVEVLSSVMNIFNLEMSMFNNIIQDSRSKTYEISHDAKKLTADLSRRSYSAKETVKKVLRKNSSFE